MTRNKTCRGKNLSPRNGSVLIPACRAGTPLGLPAGFGMDPAGNPDALRDRDVPALQIKKKRLYARRNAYLQSFSVSFSYPVHFTRDVFGPANPLLASVCGPQEKDLPCRVMAFVDAGVARADRRLVHRLESYFKLLAPAIRLAAAPVILPGGEQVKNNWGVVRRVMTQLGRCHLCRHSYVLAIGGGSLLDMAGFAASLVHRGLRLIRVPTTVLAQNDAGVGVKNGMDEHELKNFIGTFAPPHAVLVDFNFLRTLDDTHWRGGIAEAFKVAIIKDASFFKLLERNATELKRRNAQAMEQLVRRCAILHLDHIRTGGDPFEMGAARPLDFGHWSAHKLEALSGYTISHGQAVAIGIALDSVYAAAIGLITPAERNRIVAALERAGLPVWSDLLAVAGRGKRPLVLAGLDEFREHLGGRLTITLPDGIGSRIEVHEMDQDVLADASRWLQDRQ